MRKKICIATGSRADYGLLYPLLSLLKKEKSFELQIIATGMHLSPNFGMTLKEIINDGFKINEKIEMLISSDENTATVKSMGLAMITAADAFRKIKPDLLVVLGDRYEMMALVTSAYIMNIPVAHIAGGETTEGAFDEGIRHSITKMSSLHFAASKVYRNRIIQMGEDPKTVFNVGALGLDNIKQMQLMAKKELEKELNIQFENTTALVTFHPVTLDKESPGEQFIKVLDALKKFPDMQMIFTFPNSDTGSNEIAELIKKFVFKNKNARAFTNLGQKKYLSTLKYVNLVIGNSSSGIIEAPYMGVPAVNIGDRQKGRIMPENVLNVECNSQKIVSAIKKALEVKSVSAGTMNIYGNGTAAKRILSILKKNIKDISCRKKFFDVID